MDLAHSARSAAELRRDLDRCPAPWRKPRTRGFPWENHGENHGGKLWENYGNMVENHGKSVNYDGNRWKHDESWEHVGKS